MLECVRPEDDFAIMLVFFGCFKDLIERERKEDIDEKVKEGYNDAMQSV